MLKIYKYNGLTYQFEEGEQPAGAIEVKAVDNKAVEPPKKEAPKPANKAKAVKTK